MYDVNYFSVLKRQKQKNKNVRIIFIGFLVFLLAINAALLTFGYLAKTKLENHIKQNQQYIDSPSTKAKVRDAAILDKELGIAESYLETIKLVTDGINKTSLIKLELIDHIRSLTPVTTKFESVIFKENNVELNCVSSITTDPIQFYNKLLNDNRFYNVFMPGFTINQETGQVSFEIRLTLNGGDQS